MRVKNTSSLLFLLIVLLLSACGGGGGGAAQTAKEIALEKIAAYAKSSSNPTPTLQDYIDAGVTGVTNTNLADINAVVDGLDAEDVDTTTELEALTTQLNINIIPIVDAGADKTVQVNQSITITGTASDSDGSIASYEWTKGSTVLATTASFSYTPIAVGTDILTLTVTDNDGDSASDSTDVVVTPIPNVPPTADAGGDETVEVNQSITITGTASDSDGTIASYEWTKGNTVLVTTASFSYTPSTVGTDTLTLTVTDNDGATARDTMKVVVTPIPNVPPTADAGLDQTATENQSITITGSADDSDGTIASFEWTKGNTVLVTTASFSYKPSTVGTDTLTLTVTDNDGDTATDSMDVQVSKAIPDTDRFLTFINEKNDFLIKKDFKQHFTSHNSTYFDCTSEITFDGETQYFNDDLTLTGSTGITLSLYSNINIPKDTQEMFVDNQLDLHFSTSCSDAFFHRSIEKITVLNRDMEVVNLTVGELLDIRSKNIIPASNNGNGSKVAANNYYSQIDRENEKTTLNDWYFENRFIDDRSTCSDSNGCDFNADVIKAVYLNNVDLNLGRLMRVLVNDKWGTDPVTENLKVSACVENYFTLSEAIQADKNNTRKDMAAAVCMDYLHYADGFTTTTFYTYKGDGNRTTVADLDFRGDKYQPGVCLTCHGGENNEFTDFILSGFIPWDLDNFKFSNETGYTRADQETAFRLMNQAVLLTYPADAPIRELVHGWYGSNDPTKDTLPERDFKGDYVLPGWEQDKELYHQVYARYCRACHMQQSIYGGPVKDFNTASELIENDKVYDYVYQAGIMPLAKRTFDLFWQNIEGEESQAKLLFEKLENKPSHIPISFDYDFSSAKRTMPGKPIAKIKPPPPANEGINSIMLDGRDSLFADSYLWEIKKPSESNAMLFGDNTSTPTLYFSDNILDNGTYEITLKVTNTNKETGLKEEHTTEKPAIVSKGVPLTFINNIYRILSESCMRCHAVESTDSDSAFANFPMFKDVGENDHVNKTYDEAIKKINLSTAADSLLLTKPTNTVPHEGSQIFRPESTEYKTIRKWIQEAIDRPAPPKDPLFKLVP